MFLASFPAGPLQANCYLAAAGEGAECLIIDPGMDAAEMVRRVVDERNLRPVGVLLTHGHVDHVASATDLADGWGVPAWIHPDDRDLLSNPAAGVSRELAASLGDSLSGWHEPAALRLLSDGESLDVAGLSLSVIHAPGHRPGCVMFSLDYPDHPELDRVVFTGDVVFAGSIGRTDLPGGNPEMMAETLTRRVLALPDSAALLPGHGPQTVMGRERATNPYLQAEFLRSA